VVAAHVGVLRDAHAAVAERVGDLAHGPAALVGVRRRRLSEHVRGDPVEAGRVERFPDVGATPVGVRGLFLGLVSCCPVAARSVGR